MYQGVGSLSEMGGQSDCFLCLVRKVSVGWLQWVCPLDEAYYNSSNCYFKKLAYAITTFVIVFCGRLKCCAIQPTFMKMLN